MNSLFHSVARATSLSLVASAAISFASEAPIVATLPKGAVVPDAEVDDKGRIHVAYLSGNDVFYVRSSDEGQTYSKPIRVNSEPDFASGAAFRGPDLAVGKDGRIHVIWYNAGYQQKRPQKEWGVMYSHLDAKSQRFAKARNLNQRPSDNFSLAADRDGRVAVAWTAEGAFLNLSKDGGKTFAAAQKLELDPCECCGTRALYARDGSLLLLYRDKADNIRDTKIARLPAGSSTWADHQVSRTPWPIDSCPMTGSFLRQSTQGVFAAWETKGQPYFARFNVNSRSDQPTEFRVAPKGRYPVVLASTKHTLVSWKVGTVLRWRFFDKKGTPLGKPGNFQSSNPHRPSGSVTPTGKFVLFP